MEEKIYQPSTTIKTFETTTFPGSYISNSTANNPFEIPWNMGLEPPATLE